MATVMAGNNRDRDEVRQHSGWLIPAIVFVVTAGLSALFLLFYLVPSPTAFIEQRPSLTTRTDPVTLEVDGKHFTVPANYLVYDSTRQGGQKKDVSLVTMLPDFQGYTASDALAFNNHSADSPVIYVLIRREPLNLPERERLKRIYMVYVVNAVGTAGPFGLTQYVFRDDSGYRDEDLFVGHNDGRLVVMRCWRFSIDLPNPNCLSDRQLGKGVAMTYRFKRANLGQWRDIAAGVYKLIAGFEARAK